MRSKKKRQSWKNSNTRSLSSSWGKSTYLNTPSGTDEPLKTVLSCTNGVGRAEVIASECGVVVVCDGAEDAKVRLDIIRAVSSYTGFASDKITILKMTD